MPPLEQGRPALPHRFTVSKSGAARVCDTPFYLGPLAKLVNDYLALGSVNVIALLNLDTGDYHIQEVYTPAGERLHYLDGRKSIKTATNFLVYYYAR